METFALIMGHLVGDYVFQCDWEAKLKSAVHPGPKPDFGDKPVKTEHLIEFHARWQDKCDEYARAKWACTWHCLTYTLAVWIFAGWFLPWWAYTVVFAAHWPVDRYRLARRFMDWNSQKAFANGIFSPWSVVMVDNIFHLAVLYALGCAALYL